MDAVSDLFVRGGPVMWPLFLCSLVSLTIAIERLIFWSRDRFKRDDDLVEKVFKLTGERSFDEALEQGKGSFNSCVRMLVSGLRHREHGLSEAMQVEAGNEIERMKTGLAALDTIVTMAPLLGILGTVLGIIDSFELLGASGIGDPKAVTGGIAQALITTATGLSIAIVTLIPLNYFMSRVQREARKLEQISTEFEVAYRQSISKDS
jgi:biopolymer transport protein ExbB